MSSLPEIDAEKWIKSDPRTALGHNVPVALIDTIQDNLYQKAWNWLRDNGAPTEIVDAFDLSNLLRLYSERIKTGELQDVTALDLPADLIHAADLLTKFGGDYLDGDHLILGPSQIPEWNSKA